MLNSKKIKEDYHKIAERTKDFLLSEKSREFFVFLFFFFIAGGYWLLQTLNNDYEKEFTIPVKLKGVPDNVVITSEPASELHIKVKDKGTVLLNYMLGKSFYPLAIDFAEHKGSHNHVRLFAPDYEKWVSGQLNVSTQLLSIKPDTLEYYYATGTSKKVPVKLQGEVTPGRQYYLADTLFTPDSVLVHAPREVLDTLKAIYTRPVTVEELSDTLHRHVPLHYTKGMKISPAMVMLTIPVDIYTEKSVEVPLQGIGFPADKVLRTFPSKVQITFQVGLSRFRQVSADDFRLFVPYDELLRLGSEKYPVSISKQPEGISNLRISPEQVDFLIEQISPDEPH
ncbi:MAG: YbbR-like domain-containing protein [Bacteroides sp.]|nr:YbbR-like domain-containing protein [Bacteroides sp.]